MKNKIIVKKMESVEYIELGITLIILLILLFIFMFIKIGNGGNIDCLVLKSDFILIDDEKIKPKIKDEKKLSFYNMSVIKNEKGFKGVVRSCSYPSNPLPSNSYPFYVETDELGNLKNMEMIEMDYENIVHCASKKGIEDPKIFIYKGEEWIAANCLGHIKQKYKCVNQMCIFKLSNPKKTFILLNPPFENGKMQKNWTFFENKNELFCEYSLSPHIIFKVDTKTGDCLEVCRTNKNDLNEVNVGDNSSYRFNANPIFIEKENFYLGIGHVKGSLDYIHFFYSFENKYPFKILNISKEFKFENREKIQFVGAISEFDGYIYISYGVNDNSNRISKFKLEEVIKMLEHKDVL